MSLIIKIQVRATAWTLYTTESSGKQCCCHCTVTGISDITVWQFYQPFCTPNVGQVTVQDEINFQLNSDLFAATPEFTLTCTSTGGPATTVSWTRDSNAVTANNDHIISSRVTDTLAATYVHTLRVTERLVGSYSCSVSNSRTSPAAATTLQVAGTIPYCNKCM